jgi:hypothetical protein
VTTSTDGAPPSVTPEPADGSGPPPGERTRRSEREDADEALDSASAWLREEIQRRIAEGRSRSGGRHARRDTVTSPGSVGYVPRHSVATPGPGAPRPGPVGGSPSPHASELLRRERTSSPAAWSGPQTQPEENGTPEGDRPGDTPATSPGPFPRRVPGANGAPPVVSAPEIRAPAPPPDPGPARQAPTPGPRPAAATASPAAATAPSPAVPDAQAGPAPQTRESPVAEPDSTEQDARAADRATPGPAAPETLPVPAWPRPRPAPGRPARGPAWLGPPPGSVPPAEPAAEPAAEPEPADPESADSRSADPQEADAEDGQAAADRAAPPTRPVPPGPSAQATQPTSHVVPGAPALGDPVFTARTPEPGSREREWEVLGGVRVPEQRGSDQFRGGRPGPEDGQDDLQSKRVRIVLAERKSVAHPVRTVVDIQEGTGVGEFLRNDLIKTQLGIALRFAGGAGLTLGLLPLLFAVFPEVGRMQVLGVRLPWLLLGFLVYPFLFGLGLWHSRLAERVEQSFADHVQD